MTKLHKRRLIEKKRQEPKMTYQELSDWAKATFNLKKAPAKSTLSQIFRQDEMFLAEETPFDGSAKTTRKVKNQELDHALAQWVFMELQNGHQVSDEMIREKAAQLLHDMKEERRRLLHGALSMASTASSTPSHTAAGGGTSLHGMSINDGTPDSAEESDIQDLKFSNGWLDSFKRRHGLIRIKRHSHSRVSSDASVGLLDGSMPRIPGDPLFSSTSASPIVGARSMMLSTSCSSSPAPSAEMTAELQESSTSAMMRLTPPPMRNDSVLPNTSESMARASADPTSSSTLADETRDDHVNCTNDQLVSCSSPADGSAMASADDLGDTEAATTSTVSHEQSSIKSPSQPGSTTATSSQSSSANLLTASLATSPVDAAAIGLNTSGMGNAYAVRALELKQRKLDLMEKRMELEFAAQKQQVELQQRQLELQQKQLENMFQLMNAILDKNHTRVV